MRLENSEEKYELDLMKDKWLSLDTMAPIEWSLHLKTTGL